MTLSTNIKFQKFMSVAGDYQITMLRIRAACDAEAVFNPKAYLAEPFHSSYIPLAVVDGGAFGLKKEHVIFGRHEIGYEPDPEFPADFRERVERMGYTEGENIWFRKEKLQKANKDDV